LDRIRQLYRDLDYEVGLLLRIYNPQRCGFWDQGLEEGHLAQARILQALNSSKCLVALCSPGYDASDFCWDEIEFMKFRAALQPRAASVPIIKVRWIPGGCDDEFLREVHDASVATHSCYERDGLRELMRAGDADYDVIIHEKALAIAKSAHPQDPFSWDLPSISPGLIPWSEGLHGSRRLRLGVSPAPAAQPHLPRPVSTYSSKVPLLMKLLTFALLLLLSCRMVVLWWGTYAILPPYYSSAAHYQTVEWLLAFFRAPIQMLQDIQDIQINVTG